MKNLSIKEFKPTILFLVKFIGIYVLANLLYGVYVTTYSPKPDPITSWSSYHTAIALRGCGWQVITRNSETKPITQLIFEKRTVLSIYEGCNGINVMIIFVAFVIAFGPSSRAMWWFIPVGLVILHAMNLARIALLFWVSLYMPDFMYFTHKYLFTAILYVVVFVLWIWWVKKFTAVKPLTA